MKTTRYYSTQRSAQVSNSHMISGIPPIRFKRSKSPTNDLVQDIKHEKKCAYASNSIPRSAKAEQTLNAQFNPEAISNEPNIEDQIEVGRFRVSQSSIQDEAAEGFRQKPKDSCRVSLLKRYRHKRVLAYRNANGGNILFQKMLIP